MLCSQGEMRLLIFILVGATIIFSQDEGIDSIEVHPCDSPLIELKNNDEKRVLKMNFLVNKHGGKKLPHRREMKNRRINCRINPRKVIFE